MGKISSLMSKEFNSEPVYDASDKFLKAKVKLYGDKVITNFQGKNYQKKIKNANVCHLQW